MCLAVCREQTKVGGGRMRGRETKEEAITVSILRRWWLDQGRDCGGGENLGICFKGKADRICR